VLNLWNMKEFVNGPMWFAEVLLIISLGYTLWRLLAIQLLKRTPPQQTQIVTPIPSSSKWLMAVLCIGTGAVILRYFFPVSAQFYGLWIGYFSSYIFLFMIGVAAHRGNWFAQLTWRQTRPWLVAAILLWPVLPGAYALSKVRHTPFEVSGGLTWPSLLYAFWEPVIAFGAIAASLLWFRHSLNRPSAIGDWLGRRAYAVYFLHSPILVCISLMLRHWQTWSSGPILLKSILVAFLACASGWLVADPLVRLPGLRKIF
jgi:peptidoglycan/LPS O-acetylase OafA/YrhL